MIMVLILIVSFMNIDSHQCLFVYIEDEGH
jgi:hypothetical protein